jgi:hypothetical protein
LPSNDEHGCQLLVQLEPRGPTAAGTTAAGTAAAGTSLPVHPQTVVADVDIRVGEDSSVKLASQPMWSCPYEHVVVAAVKCVHVTHHDRCMRAMLAALVELDTHSVVQQGHSVAVVPANVPIVLSCKVMACM